MDTTIFITMGLVTIILIVGGVILIVLLNMVFYPQNSLKDRLEAFVYIPQDDQPYQPEQRRAQLMRFRLSVNSVFSNLASRDLRLQLTSAYWSITVTEFILIRIVATILVFILGVIFSGSLLPGVGLAILAYLLPAFILRRSLQLRRTAFERQLVDVLVLITGAVRSGYSLLQALEFVVNEASAPASEEFNRVTREVGLGVTLADALNNLSIRMENDDLYLVVTAITINTQIGGNLTNMLESVTETIRERMRLFGEIRVQTAQQRYSGYLLSMLPFILGAVLFVLNPQYMADLFEVQCIPFGAVVSVLLGNFIIQRMVKIRI